MSSLWLFLASQSPGALDPGQWGMLGSFTLVSSPLSLRCSLVCVSPERGLALLLLLTAQQVSYIFAKVILFLSTPNA